MSTGTEKKRDRAARAWQSAEGLLICPHCRSPLSTTGATAVCTDGHTFDLSRKGTLHLLSSHHNTNYDRALFESRERIIATGLYDRVLHRIADHVNRLSVAPLRLLDAGCGEGSHLRRLKALLDPQLHATCVGVDIAKPGIEIAGSGEPDVLFTVADLSRLPFASDAFSAVINFLSPANYTSFQRVLKESGRLYKVIPGPDYLHEIRQARSDVEHENYTNDAVVDQFITHMHPVERIHLHYDFPLDTSLLEDLVAMTPLGWHDHEQIVNRLKEQYAGTITIDLTLLIGEPMKKSEA